MNSGDEFESVTRSKPGPRFFDRLATAVYGAEAALALASQADEINHVKLRFTKLFLINTIPSLLKRADVTGVIQSARVMKHYRENANKLNIKNMPLEMLSLQKNKSYLAVYKIVFSLIWGASYFLPSQEDYFKRARLSCWGRPVSYIK